MWKPECGTCIEWCDERCTRVMHGLACRPVLAPRAASPTDNSVYASIAANFFTAPTGRAKDTQVAGDHYKKMGVEPWDVVDTWPIEQRIGAYRHGALKYLMRMGSKDQNAQEIAKGKHYMEKLLEVLREADDEQAALKQGENTGSIK